jgi:nitroimidazol reductase NimA-like FMN-containing flavoprotein (pyridoxamine 5'-phosphate oxidase superfamily)
MREAVRRKDREIRDSRRIEGILVEADVASIAFGGGSPYVIPMNYGFECVNGRFTLYLHGAQEGEKIDRIKADPRAAFTVYVNNRVYSMDGEEYTSSFDSVCGSGTVRFLEGAEKKRALRILMWHYAPGKEFSFPEAQLAATCVMALEVESISGKHHD